MLKILGGVVIGVFVGAFALEILNRKHPGFIRHIEDKAEKTAQAFLDAFKEGYKQAKGTPAS
jgi:hypothetical protein